MASSAKRPTRCSWPTPYPKRSWTMWPKRWRVVAHRTGRADVLSRPRLPSRCWTI
ncbi:hypothetical protein B0T14DRAFT_531953 [Immersiella caudata]|uniref:Uncharacterized protein n=1 Tax=Immersiella caudata TaxID=314043 RepID=A0AA39TJH9_9PEZI|nr:hypothetical protein B0T14DRAFT_531953 [Immersiella caudata]